MATIKTYRVNGPQSYDDIDDNFDNLNNDKIERVVDVNDTLPAIDITQSGTGDSIVVNTDEFVVDGDGNVGIGTDSPQTSLDISGRTDGISLPVGTTEQRPSVSTPTLRHNSTTGSPEYTSNGLSWGPLSSPIGNVRVFTANDQFVVPNGVTKIKVTVVGGGGGTGRTLNPGEAASGAGAGGWAVGIFDVVAGASYQVVIGLGGIAATTMSSPGGDGGQTSFGGTLIYATGGIGGSTSSGTGLGSVGGMGYGGYLNGRGNPGGAASRNSASTAYAFGGNGGDSILSGGGRGGWNINSGQSGSIGSGAGGPSGGGSSAAGGNGIVIVEW